MSIVTVPVSFHHADAVVTIDGIAYDRVFAGRFSEENIRRVFKREKLNDPGLVVTIKFLSGDTENRIEYFTATFEPMPAPSPPMPPADKIVDALRLLKLTASEIPAGAGNAGREFTRALGIAAEVLRRIDANG